MGVRYSSEGSLARCSSRETSARSERWLPSERALAPEREMLQQLSDDARIVVAEPTGDLPGAWNEEPGRATELPAKGTASFVL